MKTIRHHVGTIVIVLGLLGLVGIIDFRLCVGLAGTCSASATTPAAAALVTALPSAQVTH